MNTVVIGSSREQKLPSLVLEHSILELSSVPVRIIHTYDKEFESPKKPLNRSRTGFSFNRFAIPSLVGYKGVAAYLECDQIVTKDICSLFSIPFNGATVLRTKSQTSVLIIDCDHVRWDLVDILKNLDDGAYSYEDLMERLCVEAPFKISCSIPPEWNSLERYEEGKTALLHYTNMASQPWRKWGHPLERIWLGGLKRAIMADKISIKIVEEEVRLKHVVQEVLKEAVKWVIK